MITYGDLGNFEEPEVIGDGSDDDCDLALAAVLLHVASQRSEGHWRPVDPGHEETLQHDVVELGIGTASQESVKLKNEIEMLVHGTLTHY